VKKSLKVLEQFLARGKLRGQRSNYWGGMQEISPALPIVVPGIINYSSTLVIPPLKEVCIEKVPFSMPFSKPV